jgi:CRP-like cAMP-binding protein
VGYKLKIIKESKMKSGELGKLYEDGEIIVKEGDKGDCMYVIQKGKVEILQTQNEKDIRLAVLEEGDFFGEMAIFEKEERSATVKALGDVRALTIDKKNFLKRIHEDPSLAFHIVKNLSRRIRDLNSRHTRIRASDRRDWENRPSKLDK